MRTSLFAILLVACTPATTTAPPPHAGSRGLRRDAHADAARDHARRASELARWPNARTSDVGRFDDPSTGLWYRAWDTAAAHERLAETHRSAAAGLQAEYDEACGSAGLSEVAVSPLQRYGVGGSPTADGVLVFLSPDAGTADQLVAAMRCHRAWMMMSEREMDDCPLDLAGIRLQVYGDASGVSVEIKLRDKALVPELQRRAARDLEISSRRRSGSE